MRESPADEVRGSDTAGADVTRSPAAPGSLRPLSELGLGDELIWGLVDSAPDGIVMADEGGTVLLVNRKVEELFGYDRSELLGLTVEQLVPRRFAATHRAHRTRYRADPLSRPMGMGLALFGRRKDGAEFPVEISLSPLRSESGLFVVAVVRDVTERLAAEADSRRVQALLDATREGVFIFDRDTLRFSYVNQGALEQVGYSRDELMGMTPLHIAPELTEARLRELLSPLEAGGSSSVVFTTVHRRRDGVDVPVEVLVQAPGDEDDEPGTFFVELVRDVRERVEAEEQLRRAGEELRLLEERERIARDLHDVVIQRVFAAGMALQAVAPITVEPRVAQRIDDVVEELDETIRSLRTTIYGLEARSPGRPGLRQQILDVVAEERIALPAEPRISLDGVLDAVPDEVTQELLPSLREMLSNVARHARAQVVEVSITAGEDVVLRVVDDGVGLDPGATPGNGLHNIGTRARRLGGVLRAERGEGGGTLVEWIVPNRLS